MAPPPQRDRSPTSVPEFSVVMAVFNGEATVAATLASICSQIGVDLEVIVVNDGSTDGTGVLLDAAAAVDGRIRVEHLAHNVGRSAARNQAMSLARGTWICPMDADDLWARHRLARFAAAIEQYPAADSFTDDLIEFEVGEDGTIELGHRYVSRVSWRMGGTHELQLDPWFRDRECHMRACIRRDLIERFGLQFPEQLSAGEDLAFYLSVAFAPGTRPPVRVAEANYYYRQGRSTRAANMAESRVLLTRYAIAATGNEQLARLVAETNPANVFMSRRGDRILAERGRSAERDAGVDDVELTMDRIGGYRQLVRNKCFEMLGRRADRHLRPGIRADIAAQLDGDLTRTT